MKIKSSRCSSSTERETFYRRISQKTDWQRQSRRGQKVFNLQLFDGAALDMVSLRVETEALPLMAPEKMRSF